MKANEHKHTPGPWRVDDGYHETQLEIFAECGHRIAVVTMTYPMGAARVDANARLIAAAPELLEALKYLLDLSEAGSRAFCKAHGVPYGDGPLAHQLARAAIAKATGKEADTCNRCGEAHEPGTAGHIRDGREWRYLEATPQTQMFDTPKR